MNEQELRFFGAVITHVMAGRHLSREEAKRAFAEILLGDQPDLQKGALLATLRMKGETADEIAGCFEAIYELDTNRVRIGYDDVVENCGTGMDTLKTFNVSTLAAVVAATLGARLARHGARAITSRCGTVDLCEALGIDVECDVETVRRSVETCGLGLFNGTSPQVHPLGLGRVLSQIRFGSTLNIAASLANPALPRIALRGVGAVGQIEPTLDVMERIGYRRAVLCHGWDECGRVGMDEISNLGPSRLGILENGCRRIVEVTPEAVGLRRGCREDLKPRDTVTEEAVEAVRLLAGKGNPSRTDIVALNAGAILWVAGRADSLEQGTAESLNKISTGAPLEKLQEWVQRQNRKVDDGLRTLSSVVSAAGLSL
ncbi:MAG: anthranilate phosphoribosyltransferase [Pseudomonadota bacterium]|nr:anthranilate phosphoribosyltransferase [Pseudomonadota bacterium]